MVTSANLKFQIKGGFKSQLSTQASGTCFFGKAINPGFDLAAVAEDYDVALVEVLNSTLIESTRKPLDVYHATDIEKTGDPNFFSLAYEEQAFLLSVNVDENVKQDKTYRLALVHKDTNAVILASVQDTDGLIDFKIKFDVLPDMVVRKYDTDAIITGNFHLNAWGDQSQNLFKVAITGNDPVLYVEEDESSDPAGVALFTTVLDSDASTEFVSVFTVQLRSDSLRTSSRSLTLIARTGNGYSLSRSGLSVSVWDPIVVSTTREGGFIKTLAGKDYYSQDADTKLFKISTTGGNSSDSMTFSTNQSANSLINDDNIVQNLGTMETKAAYLKTFVVSVEQYGRTFTASRAVWRVSGLTASLAINKTQTYAPGAVAGQIELTGSSNYGVGGVTFSGVSGYTFASGVATNASALSAGTYNYTATATDGLGRTASTNSVSVFVVDSVGTSIKNGNTRSFTVEDLTQGNDLITDAVVQVTGGTNPVVSLTSIVATKYDGTTDTANFGITANGNSAALTNKTELVDLLEIQDSSALKLVTVTWQAVDTSAGRDTSSSSVQLYFKQKDFAASIGGEDLATLSDVSRLLLGTSDSGNITKNLALVTDKDVTTVPSEAAADRVNRYAVTFAIDYADGGSVGAKASASIVSTSNAYKKDLTVALSIHQSIVNTSMILKVISNDVTLSYPFFFVSGTVTDTVGTGSDLINATAATKLAVNNNPSAAANQVTLTKGSSTEESRRAFFDAKLQARSPVVNEGSLTIFNLGSNISWDDSAAIYAFLDQQTLANGYKVDGGASDVKIVPHSDVNNTSALRSATQVSQLDLDFENDKDLKVRIALNEDIDSVDQLTNANRYYIVALTINSTNPISSYRVLKLNNLGIVQTVVGEVDQAETFPDAISLKVTEITNNVNFADLYDWKIERKLPGASAYEEFFSAEGKSIAQINDRLRRMPMKQGESLLEYTIADKYYRYRVGARAPQTPGTAYVFTEAKSGYVNSPWALTKVPVELSPLKRIETSFDGKFTVILSRKAITDPFHNAKLLHTNTADDYAAGDIKAAIST